MSKRVSLHRVSTTAAKVVMSFLAATLFVTLLLFPSRSVRAGIINGPCAKVTGGRAFYTPDEGYTDLGQDEHVRWPCCSDEVHLKVSLSDGTTKDVSLLPGPVSYSSGGTGCFLDERYCPSKDDINKEFPLYVDYCDPCTGQTWRFTVHMHVD